MKRGWTFLSVGTGAGLMYLLDPERGRRRRAILRDKAKHASREARRALGLASRDLVNRTRGMAAEVRHKIARGATSDDILIERIRARIGHVVSHPHAIHVEAEDGRVTLTGAILQEEVVACVEAVEAVPGVSSVESLFDIHDDADIPALAGGPRRPVARGKLRPTPGGQLAAAAAGVVLGFWGRRRGGIAGLGLRGLGYAFLLSELAGFEVFRDLLADVRPRLGTSR